jgi:hypothetical protein
MARLSVTVGYVALLLPIWEVSVPVLSLKLAILIEVFVIFSASQANARILSKIRY